MFKLDDQFLNDVGLGNLPAEEKKIMLQHIYEKLELNVGMRLASGMSDQQLDDFEKLMDANDQAGALKWLETNVPHYKQVVAEELEKLKAEIKKDAAAIVENSQAA
jgi:archaellum component FlaC